MVQQRCTSPDEFWSIFTQNSQRYDGHKIQEINDKILPRYGIRSLRTHQFHQMEILMIEMPSVLIDFYNNNK